MAYYIAIDFGGTKTAAVVKRGAYFSWEAGEGGWSSNVFRLDTPQTTDLWRFDSEISGWLRDVVRNSGVSFDQVAGLSVSVPGFSRRHGTSLNFQCPNIPALNVPGGVPFVDQLARTLRAPAVASNDGNLALLAEVEDPSGSALGETRVLGITWSSGVGGGVYVKDETHNGIVHFGPLNGKFECPAEDPRDANAPEIGHWQVNFGPDALPCTEVLPGGEQAVGHLESELGGRANALRGLDPALAHPQLVAAGVDLFPKTLAPLVAKYQIEMVVMSGTIGRTLMAEADLGPQLEEAFGSLGLGLRVRRASFENASLTGAELNGANALADGRFSPPGLVSPGPLGV